MSLKKFELNRGGVRELLTSKEAQECCRGYASSVLQAAGEGFEMGNRNYPERAGAAVYPVTEKARRKNLEENTLLRALYD